MSQRVACRYECADFRAFDAQREAMSSTLTPRCGRSFETLAVFFLALTGFSSGAVASAGAAGSTFSRYLTEIRIGYACKLLMENKANISAICYESGFNNLSKDYI